MIKIDNIKILPRYRTNDANRNIIDSKKKSSKKKTTEQYKKEINEINPNIEVLDEYNGANIKINHRCKIDDYVWSACPTNILKGHGCPKCSGNSKKTHEDFIKQFNNLPNKKVSIIGRYTNSTTKIECSCLFCGDIIYIIPSDILNNAGCRKCSIKNASIQRRKSTTTFKSELKDINKNIISLEEYINSNTPIKFKCLICNNVWKTKPAHILDGHGCRKCSSKNSAIKRSKTHDNFVNELKKLNSFDIEIIGKYKNSNTKIECMCNICKKIWSAFPSNLLSGHGCPYCSNSYKKTTQEFINELKYKNNIIEVLGEYISAKDNILCKCKICNHQWEPVASSLLCGSGCPKCSGNFVTEEDFMEAFKTNGNKNIKLLSPYIDSQTKIMCLCIICNNKWYATPHQLKTGVGCKKCANKNNGLKLRLSHKEFIDRVYKNNPNIKVIGKYTTSHDNIECKCIICGNIWFPNAFTIMTSTGCPICSSSKGENLISRWLQNNNVFYNSQKTFKNLLGVGKGLLSYDFYLPQYNLLIEFQGEQHERPIEHFGGEKQFKKQQEHDKRKREYAKQNNINLLEIWYYDIDNIESILIQKINELKENNLKLESVETVTVA